MTKGRGLRNSCYGFLYPLFADKVSQMRTSWIAEILKQLISQAPVLRINLNKEEVLENAERNKAKV